MNLESGLEARQKEITDLENEIKQIQKDAETMLETVHKYQRLKEQESDLKKLKRKKENDLKIVVSFFADTESHYLDNIHPLFKGNQDLNKREEISVEPEVVNES